MAALNDLINQVQDANLRDRLLQEASKLQKQRKFGLVYEEHIPEATLLYDVPIRKGLQVALRDGKISDCYLVKKIDGNNAHCVKMDESHEEAVFAVADLVAVAHFGEPIYPCLRYKDSICNAPDSDLWHTLIEADNYHALQLLEYLYGGQVDCIYIDPPYNTGARDWKYNNNYVDGNDSYRHSKWLSMMEKRLKLAKKLLNPQNSVLIVTIDEKEYLHLGCLLEQMFPEARIQMVSSVINPAGVSRNGEFARTDEYIYFVKLGISSPCKIALSEDWKGKIKGGYKDKLRWNGLQRSGTEVLRSDRPNMFYPIYVKRDGSGIAEVGDPLPLHVDRHSVIGKNDYVMVWPIFPDGREGRWRLGRESLLSLIPQHFVRIGKLNGENTSITYLAQGEQNKINTGAFNIVGYRKDGSIIVDEALYEARYIPGTQWWIPSHDATQLGTKILSSLIGKGKFAFPKSLYAVHDTIRFFVADKPNALIVDFFAGSGTTLHAVNLLNAEDGGHRRCIMVTNNEVSEEEAKALTAKGYKVGDEEWEKLGIANYVTWPRTTCSILGKNIKGEPLKGEYLNTPDKMPMAGGFAANAVFFKLGFLDKTMVSLGRQFKELLPLLWMKAGAKGQCPTMETEEVPTMLVLPDNKFAVLTDESAFCEFAQQVNADKNIETIFIVTDAETSYHDMIAQLRCKHTFQLYRDYLDNFRINKIR